MWNDTLKNPEIQTTPQEIYHEEYISIDEGLPNWDWVKDYIGESMAKWWMLHSENYDVLPDLAIEKLRSENISHSDLIWVVTIQDYCIFHYYDSHWNTHEIVFQKWYKDLNSDIIGSVWETKNSISPIENKEIMFTKVALSLDDIKLKEKEEEETRIENNAENLRILEALLKAMDQVFQKDKKEWNKQIGDEDRIQIDTSEFPWWVIAEIQWKKSLHLNELQKIAQKIIWELQNGELDRDMRELLSNSEEQYLDYIVWIWDTYEWGARAFHSDVIMGVNLDQLEIENLVERLVERKSVPELFEYMLDRHAKIEANNYQSTEVQRTYEHWTHTLNRKVLDRMKDENVDSRLFHRYALIVSGRRVVKLSDKLHIYRWYPSHKRVHSLDRNLFDPESATEALLYVFERPGWVFEKLYKEKGFNITDPLAEKVAENERIPKNAIKKCTKLIEEKVEWFSEAYQWESLLKKAGFGSMFDIEKPYHECTLSEKMQVWIIVRLIKKLEAIQNPADYSTRYYSKHKWHREWGDKKTGKISFERFWELFLEVWEEWQEAIIVEINEELDGGWFGSKNNLTSLSEWEQELYDLYNDMWWNDGIFDISDMNIETLKALGQFWAVLIGSIGLAIALTPIAVAGIWAVAWSSIAANAWSYAFMTTAALSSVWVSRIVIPEWYDSNKDMYLDLVTDSIVAVAFWLIWWKMTQASYARFMQNSGKWLSWEGMKHMGYNAIDIGILWISTELLRNYILRTQDIQLHKNIPVISNEGAIDAKNRFFKEDFHTYVRMNLEPYIERKS